MTPQDLQLERALACVKPRPPCSMRQMRDWMLVVSTVVIAAATVYMATQYGREVPTSQDRQMEIRSAFRAAIRDPLSDSTIEPVIWAVPGPESGEKTHAAPGHWTWMGFS